MNPGEIQQLGTNLFTDFWKLWCSREKNSVQRISAMTAEHFSGVGTNVDERWHSRIDLLEQLQREWTQIPMPYGHTVGNVEAFALDPASILVMGDVELSIHVHDRTISLDSVRNTQIYLREGDSMLLAHWHCSIPDGGIGGEVAPGSFDPRLYDETSILFFDLVDYTKIVESLTDETLVHELNTMYSEFDGIMEEFGIERLMITGDGYVAVCGLPEFRKDHARRCILAAQRMLDCLQERKQDTSINWMARVGIHSGPIRAGIFGRRRFSLNAFGDTVNIASRLESSSEPGRINISAYTHELIKEDFDCEYRGKVAIKGKGEIDMYFVGEEIPD